MIKTLIKTIIVFAIIAAAGAVAYYLVNNPAQTKKKEVPQRKKIWVTTQAVNLDTYPVKIELMGQVIPAHEAALRAQISGEITEVSAEFIPGGFFKKGEEILQIDPANYELDIKIKKATLRQANAALKLELGRQEIAKKELEIIKQSTGKAVTNSALALRMPQLEQARANISAAKAALELAQLNLERTKIKAPFNALIVKRSSDLGDIISSQDILATLVNIDEYWVNAEIPVSNLRWLKPNAKAIINLDGNRDARIGTLLRTTGSLNEKSRLANIIISIPDPLLKQDNLSQGSTIILQDYVHVTLIGKRLQNTARILLSYLRDGNNLWLERDGKLIIQKVSVAYQDRKYAYITKGVGDNDNIITSNIITPIHGMDVMDTKAQNHE